MGLADSLIGIDYDMTNRMLSADSEFNRLLILSYSNDANSEIARKMTKIYIRNKFDVGGLSSMKILYAYEFYLDSLINDGYCYDDECL